MQPHEKTLKLLPRVEPVEQLYDGLNGKVIKWTLENGNKSHDPSCLAYLLDRAGKVVSKCPNPYSASSFSKWLKEEVTKYEKTHPRTRVPFVPPTIDEEGACTEFDEAKQERKRILIYVGRESGTDKQAKKQIKACRKFEKGTLSSKKAAEEAKKGWVLLRFDIADETHAKFLKRFGVDAAPALLMFHANTEEPTNLGTKVKGPNLAYFLKKAR